MASQTLNCSGSHNIKLVLNIVSIMLKPTQLFYPNNKYYVNGLKIIDLIYFYRVAIPHNKQVHFYKYRPPQPPQHSFTRALINKPQRGQQIPPAAWTTILWRWHVYCDIVKFELKTHLATGSHHKYQIDITFVRHSSSVSSSLSHAFIIRIN